MAFGGPETFPLYYHGRTKGNSDRHEIAKRMFVFKPDHKIIVAEKYSRIFRENGRKTANAWLHKLAVKYRKLIIKSNEQKPEKLSEAA